MEHYGGITDMQFYYLTYQIQIHANQKSSHRKDIYFYTYKQKQL